MLSAPSEPAKGLAPIISIYKSMNINVGRRGEEIAADYLKKKGYKIIARNWKPAKLPTAGEIDIVAKRGEDFVFVEVKALSQNDTFYPEDHFTPDKAAKTIRAARLWLAENNSLDRPWQIDLIAIEMYAGGQEHIFHYEQVVS